MTECAWLICHECGASCPDYDQDGEPDDGHWHRDDCSCHDPWPGPEPA